MDARSQYLNVDAGKALFLLRCSNMIKSSLSTGALGGIWIGSLAAKSSRGSCTQPERDRSASPFMDETSASAPGHHDNPRSGPSQPTGSPEHGKASSCISSPPLLRVSRPSLRSQLELEDYYVKDP